jgi:hypothetical protein
MRGMTFHKQYQSWLIGLGVTLTLLWTSQIAADWFKPHNEIEFSQHSKIELALVIEHEWGSNNRTFRLENKPDPAALTTDFSVPARSGRGLWLTPFAVAGVYSSQASGLPGIRAPPPYNTSA